MKKNITTTATATAAAPMIPASLMSYKDDIKKIADILGINLPYMQTAECVFSVPVPGTENEQVGIQQVFKAEELPDGATLHGGYYISDQQVLLLASKYPVFDLNEGLIGSDDKTPAEQIYTIAHELRHAWQVTFNKEYHSHDNIVGDMLNDSDEVDADAFAISYILGGRNYSVDDIPHQHSELILLNVLDGGARLKCALSICDQYGFNSANIKKFFR